ncbi:MAG: rod shape-determining protein MreD [Planctomycetes bacterium]|nr:rod shape-determining protein MreD [Planctomycetota bacterium]
MMRWPAFGICAICVLTLQVAIAPRLELFGQRPDWLLVVIVFFALYSRSTDAVLGAWCIGMVADLMSIERFGLLSLSYAGACLGVVAVRTYLFRHHLITQVVVTFLAGAMLQCVWTVYQILLYEQTGLTMAAAIGNVIVGAAYTAMWVPPIHWLLQRRSRSFGIVRPRYLYSG